MAARYLIGTLLLWVLHLGTQALPAQGADPQKVSPEQSQFFETEIRPLLLDKCVRCHGPDKSQANLRLDSHEALLAGGDSGPAVTLDKPENSLLLEAINYGSFEMPPDGKLAEDQIEKLTRWVQMGAPWPASSENLALRGPKQITEDDRAFWSFQPLAEVTPPATDDGGWCRNEIDHFIWQRLAEAGLSPSPEADKRTLIRRATFDLHGLAPTPEEVDAFLADDSPQAYPQLIERLLQSPRYGERWARHWLDLVRYAESDGFKQDAYRPQAWRYRDYVIAAFNADKPYDRFVVEQLAGDEIDPQDPQMLVATSLFRLGIYEYNQRDVRTQWSNILNDITDVTADVFLGLGMGCARCHDHKFDPLLQEDYYRLQAFFTPLLPRDDLTYLRPDEQVAYEQRRAVWEAATQEIRREIAQIEQPLRERTAAAAINKFPPDIRPMLQKAPSERAPFEHQLAELAGRQIKTELENLKFDQKLKGETLEWPKQLHAKLAEFNTMKPEPPDPAFTATDVGTTPPPTLIPGKETGTDVLPGIPVVMTAAGETALPVQPLPHSTGRRLALARWITDPQNSLSARVIANRLWQYHMGRGLVTSSSDFGRLGEPPSHPELLDWLTRRLIAEGWSLKQMHRLIMNSATYRQSSQRVDTEMAMLRDPENRLLWRMPARRLDAEQIRDAMLAVSGELDLSSGGPAVEATTTRRTIYTKMLRNVRDPLLAVFDAPDGFNSTAQRNVTTTPTQSLLMINGPWTLGRAEAFARRVLALPLNSAEARVTAAYRFAYGRAPDSAELQRAVQFLTDQASQVPPAESKEAAAPADPQTAAWVDLCHVLLNSSEFLYVP